MSWVSSTDLAVPARMLHILSTNQTHRLLQTSLLSSWRAARPALMLQQTEAAHQAALVPHPAEAWSAAEQSWLRKHSRWEQGTSDLPLMTYHECSGFKLAQWKPRCNRIVAEGPADLNHPAVWRQGNRQYGFQACASSSSPPRTGLPLLRLGTRPSRQATNAVINLHFSLLLL